MSPLYSYERKQRRSALTLLFNGALLVFMAAAAHRFAPPTEAGEQLLYWIDIAAPVAVGCLVLSAAFLWMRNGTYRMAVDAGRFEVVDPLSAGASFSVEIAEIEEIRQSYLKHVEHSQITMHLRSGEVLSLSLNHRYSRKDLYAALAQANPEIALPASPWRFQQVA